MLYSAPLRYVIVARRVLIIESFTHRSHLASADFPVISSNRNHHIPQSHDDTIRHIPQFRDGMIRIASVHAILQRLLRKRLLCTHHGILPAEYSPNQPNATSHATSHAAPPHASLRHLCNITDNTAIPQRLGAISSEMVWFFTPPRRHPDQDRNMCRSAPCTKRCQLTTFFKSIG